VEKPPPRNAARLPARFLSSSVCKRLVASIIFLFFRSTMVGGGRAAPPTPRGGGWGPPPVLFPGRLVTRLVIIRLTVLPLLRNSISVVAVIKPFSRHLFWFSFLFLVHSALCFSRPVGVFFLPRSLCSIRRCSWLLVVLRREVFSLGSCCMCRCYHAGGGLWGVEGSMRHLWFARPTGFLGVAVRPPPPSFSAGGVSPCVLESMVCVTSSAHYFLFVGFDTWIPSARVIPLSFSSPALLIRLVVSVFSASARILGANAARSSAVGGRAAPPDTPPPPLASETATLMVCMWFSTDLRATSSCLVFEPHHRLSPIRANVFRGALLPPQLPAKIPRNSRSACRSSSVNRSPAGPFSRSVRREPVFVAQALGACRAAEDSGHCRRAGSSSFFVVV